MERGKRTEKIVGGFCRRHTLPECAAEDAYRAFLGERQARRACGPPPAWRPFRGNPQHPSRSRSAARDTFFFMRAWRFRPDDGTGADPRGSIHPAARRL